MEGQDARAATSSLSQLHEDKRNAETSATFSILDFTCQVEHASLLTTMDAYIEAASKLGQRRQATVFQKHHSAFQEHPEHISKRLLSTVERLIQNI
jgi:hypothetical protein